MDERSNNGVRPCLALEVLDSTKRLDPVGSRGERTDPRRGVWIPVGRSIPRRSLIRDHGRLAIEVRWLGANDRIHDRRTGRDVPIAERVSQFVVAKQPPSVVVVIEGLVEKHDPSVHRAVRLFEPRGKAYRAIHRRHAVVASDDDLSWSLYGYEISGSWTFERGRFKTGVRSAAQKRQGFGQV